MTTTTTAAIYCRVSSEEQATNGTSLGEQDTRCRAYCTAQGWALAEVYIDAGVSGALPPEERPALARLLLEVRAGRVGAVVVAKLDRLGRDLTDLSAMLRDDFDRAGVAFVSVAETFDSSSSSGRLLRHILSSFAEHERDVIRERTLDGRIKRLRQGGWGGGNLAPFGYRVAGESKEARLQVDDAEATVVRRAVSLLLDRGMTTGEVAAALNAEGLTPRKAPRWSSTNLRNVLVRGSWSGEWTWGKVGKGEPVTVAIPAILDADRVEALRRYLSATTTGSPTREKVYPLSGRLVGTCGHPFHGIGRADRNVVRYRCRYARDVPHHPRCPEPTVRADEVEAVVWGQVRGLLLQPERLLTLARAQLGHAADEADAQQAALIRAEANVERLQRATGDVFTTGLKAGLDADTIRQASTQLQQELAEAREHVRMVKALQEQAEGASDRVRGLQRLAEAGRERLERGDPQLQERLYALLGLQVTIVSHGEGGNRAGRRGPVQLRLQGALDLDALVTGAENDWHPQHAATG